MWNRIQTFTQHRPKTVLFFIFILTVFVRLPQLARPLSKHHELNAAHLLVCLQVWNENGLSASKGSPVQFFSGTYNVFQNKENKFEKLNNSGAYLSMGAGSFLFPWLAMKLFHIPPSPVTLRIWALLIQLISVYLLYGLLRFLQRSYFKEFKNFTRIGCLLFLTTPVVMWYMGNSYSHEIMVIPFYLLMLQTGFIIRQNNYRWNAICFLSYGLFTAAAVYTDWLGAIAAFVFFIQAISVKQFKKRLPFLIVNACAVLLPVAIIFWQYISLIGWQEYQRFIVAQINRRSLPGTDVRYSIIDFVKHFATGYGLLCITAMFGSLSVLKQRNPYILLIAAIPLLHYLIFRGFSNEHDYSVMKWLPFIIVATLIAYSKLSLFWQQTAVAVTVFSSLLLYHFINRPFAISINGERYAWMKEAGQRIATEAKPDEYVFINTEGYLHQVEWYAHRNYKPVRDTAEARTWLQQQPGSKAVFFKLTDRFEVEKIIRMKQ